MNHKPVLFLFLALICGIVSFSYFCAVGLQGEHFDYAAFHTAGRSALLNQPIYFGYTSDAYPILFKYAAEHNIIDRPTHFIYPPFFLAVAIPFAMFPYITAKILWNCSGLLILCIAYCAMAVRLYKTGNLSLIKMIFLAAIATANQSVMENFAIGQSNLILFALLFLGFMIFISDKAESKPIIFVCCSVSLILFCLCRFTPIVIFPFLIIFFPNKQKIIFLILSLSVTVFLIGIIPFRYFSDYVDTTRIVARGSGAIQNLSLQSFFLKSGVLMFGERNDKIEIIKFGIKQTQFFTNAAMNNCRIVSNMAGFFLLILFFIFLYRKKNKEALIRSSIYLLLIISPILWISHFTALLIPYYLLLKKKFNICVCAELIIIFLISSIPPVRNFNPDNPIFFQILSILPYHYSGLILLFVISLFFSKSQNAQSETA
ncbi:MAG TPA: glycosyltransferase family 87 protein [bacterium]|nr:glycosyltransferase family 87 protein [bacterium]HPN30955.1 glycosyltransferase family 87 protein [bacterium]